LPPCIVTIVFETFFDHIAQIGNVTNCGHTALHIAAYNGYSKFMKTFIDKEAIECMGINFQHLLSGLPVAASHALYRAYQMCEGLDVADLLHTLEVAL